MNFYEKNGGVFIDFYNNKKICNFLWNFVCSAQKSIFFYFWLISRFSVKNLLKMGDKISFCILWTFFKNEIFFVNFVLSAQKSIFFVLDQFDDFVWKKEWFYFFYKKCFNFLWNFVYSAQKSIFFIFENFLGCLWQKWNIQWKVHKNVKILQKIHVKFFQFRSEKR